MGSLGRVLLAALLLHGFPALAAAPRVRPHASLLSSEPAAGASVTVPPSRIRLVFSEPIEPALTSLTLAGAAGGSFPLAAASDPHDVHAVIASAPPLPAGVYVVTWRVVSADGHRVDGSFGFTVQANGANIASTALDSGNQRSDTIRPPLRSPTVMTDSGFVASLGPRPLVAELRAAAITALLALAGLTLLISTLPISGPRPLRMALILGVLTFVLLLAYTVVWSRTAVGSDRGMMDAMSITAPTTPGALEIARVALVFLAVCALGAARRPGLAALFSLVAVIITGASGHPAVTAPMITIPAKSIHLVAASVWLGGLLWIVTAERHGARYVEGTRRISSLAFVAVIVVLATGILQSILFLPRVSALTNSTYGQIVLAKTAGLLVLVLFGVFHRRAIPRLDTTMARRRLRGSVRFEIIVMIAVAALGGLLAAIAPPR